MNPFEEKPVTLEPIILNWKALYPSRYDGDSSDPYTACRIMLMNAVEIEAIRFGHAFNRHCADNAIRHDLAMLRRIEQQQQKKINWLNRGDVSPLKSSIFMEHLGVDLTAWLASREPDAYARQCMEFALLDNLDHLYRFSNLLKLDGNFPAHELVGDVVEIMPGRPTIAHHRHPADTVRRPFGAQKTDVRTKLSILILTAAAQQAMDFYMNAGPGYPGDIGQRLYQEIAMVKEEHVTAYGSLLPSDTGWLEDLLLSEYMECYLYYSFLTDEGNREIRAIWEFHFQQELAHLHKAADLLLKHENRHWSKVVPGEFPELLHFTEMKDAIRDVLARQVELTAKEDDFADVRHLPADDRFFVWQDKANGEVADVPSHRVVEAVIREYGEDYRAADAINPVAALDDRLHDNTETGRTKWAN